MSAFSNHVQVTGSEGEMSGTLQRSRNSKRSWKSLWFHLKDKVLYTYPQPEVKHAGTFTFNECLLIKKEGISLIKMYLSLLLLLLSHKERVACESLPLVGFSVKSENEGESSVFQLYHNTTLYYTFRAQDTHTAQR